MIDLSVVISNLLAVGNVISLLASFRLQEIFSLEKSSTALCQRAAELSNVTVTAHSRKYFLFFPSKKYTRLEIAGCDEKCAANVLLLGKRGTYPAKDQHVTAARLPLRPVSYLEHTNEDWIRYQLNDGRNVLVNIYDNRLLYACMARRENVFGITLQDTTLHRYERCMS